GSAATAHSATPAADGGRPAAEDRAALTPVDFAAAQAAPAAAAVVRSAAVAAHLDEALAIVGTVCLADPALGPDLRGHGLGLFDDDIPVLPLGGVGRPP